MDIYGRIEQLIKERGISAYKLSKSVDGISTGLLSQWKSRAQIPSRDKLQILADYFGVTVDFLLTGQDKEAPALNEKDERDIEKKMQEVLNDLEEQQEGLMFSGEPMDDTTRELLIASLRNSMEIGKTIAKAKYTPKKYRKDQK